MLEFLQGSLLLYVPVLFLVWMAGASFVFYYPLYMSVVWMCGATVFAWHHEPPDLKDDRC